MKFEGTTPVQCCTRCVMDTSDSLITFDEAGVCNHCHKFENETSNRWYPNEEGKRFLTSHFEKLKKDRKNKEYDCILGLSGGLDSSYLALIVKEYGLRPLVVHVDAGWNSELAVFNIEKLVKYCNFELHTIVIDWEEMRDLQLAYLKAGVANQDVPQDHAFFASLYHFAVKNDVNVVINGGNIATESVFPESWHHDAMDAINLKAIHKKFGRQKLKNYETISFYQYYFVYPLMRRFRVVRPLNYIPYNKEKARIELEEKVGFKSYGRKHGESVFTKFFQNYYLPTKFGMDKRRIHMSSLILSGTMTRDEALKELEKPLYDLYELDADKQYIAKKLGISAEELEDLINSPNKYYTDYANWDKYYVPLKIIQRTIQKLLNRPINRY